MQWRGTPCTPPPQQGGEQRCHQMNRSGLAGGRLKMSTDNRRWRFPNRSQINTKNKTRGGKTRQCIPFSVILQTNDLVTFYFNEGKKQFGKFYHNEGKERQCADITRGLRALITKVLDSWFNRELIFPIILAVCSKT